MFSNLLALFVAATFAASALANGLAPSTTRYTCNVGSLRCCNEIQAPKSAEGGKITGLVNVPTEGKSGQSGTHCNPISASGKGNGAGCASAPVCCEVTINDGKKAGLGPVSVNCNPAITTVSG